MKEFFVLSLKNKNKIKTIFLDIDGTIIKQKDNLSDVMLEDVTLLPGVIDKFNEWNWKGYKIVLTTGRKESSRAKTEESLKKLGLFWDYLIMGLDVGGFRILINDSTDISKNKTARAITVKRNSGLKNIKI